MPLLSTPIVGVAADNGQSKLVGPGHAAFTVDARNGAFYAIYHASKSAEDAGACIRYAYIAEMRWSGDDWPYITFSSQSTQKAHAKMTASSSSASMASSNTAPGGPQCRLVSRCEHAYTQPQNVSATEISCAGVRARSLTPVLSSDHPLAAAQVVAACSL